MRVALFALAATISPFSPFSLAAAISQDAAASLLPVMPNMTNGTALGSNMTNATAANATNATDMEPPRPLTDEEKEEAQAMEQQRLANERMEKRVAAKEAEAEAQKKAEEAAAAALQTRARAKEKALEAKKKRDERRLQETEEVHRRKAAAREPRVNSRDVRTEAGLRHAFQSHWHEEDSILPLLHDAHAKVSTKHEDKHTRVGDLAELVVAALNPDEHGPVHPEEHHIIEVEVAAMRQQEGLVDDSTILHHGFLLRGGPLEFFQRVSRKLSAARGARP